MPYHAGQAIKLADHGIAVQVHSQLFFEVSVRPQVVVAGVVMDRYSAVCNASYGTEQAGAALWNGMLVFVPKIEDVADQVNFRRRTFVRVIAARCGVLEPTDET
jgi:hypothetical protein